MGQAIDGNGIKAGIGGDYLFQAGGGWIKVERRARIVQQQFI